MKAHKMTGILNSPKSDLNFRLHPLIHTLLEFNLAQDFASLKNANLFVSSGSLRGYASLLGIIRCPPPTLL